MDLNAPLNITHDASLKIIDAFVTRHGCENDNIESCWAVHHLDPKVIATHLLSRFNERTALDVINGLRIHDLYVCPETHNWTEVQVDTSPILRDLQHSLEHLTDESLRQWLRQACQNPAKYAGDDAASTLRSLAEWQEIQARRYDPLDDEKAKSLSVSLPPSMISKIERQAQDNKQAGVDPKTVSGIIRDSLIKAGFGQAPRGANPALLERLLNRPAASLLATEAMLCWTPGTDSVALVPWPDTRGLSDHFEASSLACWDYVQKMDFRQRQILVLIEATHLMVSEGCSPQAVHRALCGLREYCVTLAEDAKVWDRGREIGRHMLQLDEMGVD
ncbi:hypothetical protein [Geopseudomonas aromaticivorans]